jgi:hypothetical protein
LYSLCFWLSFLFLFSVYITYCSYSKFFSEKQCRAKKTYWAAYEQDFS